MRGMAKQLLPLSVAALAVELTGQGEAPRVIRMIPAGEFRSIDGRPEGLKAWTLSAANAVQIVAQVNALKTPRVIDWEHQTLRSQGNGQPAPAAGWFSTVEWRDGDGLYATDVEWTAEAAEQIAAKKYRFISPVFGFDGKTGAVVSLAHAALTNTPGLDGLTDLAALAASLFPPVPIDKETPMKLVLAALGLAATATEPEIVEAIAALKSSHTTETAALSAQIATLKTAAPDPAKYVEIATLNAVQGELATAKSELEKFKTADQDAKIDKLVTEALSAGKLTPATEDWARNLGKNNFAALSEYIEKAQAVVKPGGTQTGGKKPEGGLDVDDSNAVAEAALSYQTEQAAKGITLSTPQAVAHVIKNASGA